MSTTVQVKTDWRGDEVKVIGKKVVNKTAFEIGLVVEGQAKLLCPRDLGYLAASINVQSVDMGTELGTVEPNPSNPAVKPNQQHRLFWEEMPTGFVKIMKPAKDNEIHVGTAVEYGPYVEFGTVNMDSQPFLRPALDLAMGKTLTLLKENGRLYFADFLRRPS